ncbi:hypothetical protein PanWU01x14_275140 [Parasponia andersonii]|uniref:Uncharacterized protein n=1 Tax=Parasponia andersonii TaxID=3476 RepID=A0A2P5B3I4_PARAD|nr:hypothetical protein PanWU01x14_275140 [Parasponia andersonii]
MSLQLGPSRHYGPGTLPRGNARGTLAGTHLRPTLTSLGLAWFFAVSVHPRTASGKSLQKSSNPFMDFSGSYLNHSRVGPARVVEKTLQVTASSLGVDFPLERPEGLGREVPQSGLHLDPINKGHPVDPSHSLFCQIVGGLAVIGPEVSTSFAVPPASTTRMGQELLLAVDFRSLVGPFHPNLLSARSCLHSPATLRGWQSSDPASVPDLIVLLRSSLRRRDVCSWLSFLRVPSDVVWFFVRRECDRESPTLFLTQPVPTDGAKLLERFLTSRPRVSGLLMMYSPTVHMSSLSQSTLNSKQGRRGVRFGQIVVLSGRLVPCARLPKIVLNALSGSGVVSCFPLYSDGRPLELSTPPVVEVRVGLGRVYPRSVMGSALNSKGPTADCDITCDPCGLQLITLDTRQTVDLVCNMFCRLIIHVVHDLGTGPTERFH